ncbi:response regulator transcription factor [Nonomuraea sp. NPDC050680]|uniref:response regulator n=1 Tax=Nonomuraea sp. NPDC050680 TaxID=3154630 RepID=UPI00340C2C03
MLEIEDDIEVAGEAADGEEVLRVAGQCRPDVALVDARMPRMDGTELIRRLSAGHLGVAAIVLSTFDEDDYIFGALSGGAVGYLLKDCTPEELVDAIRRASRGETVLASPSTSRTPGTRTTPPPERQASRPRTGTRRHTTPHRPPSSAWPGARDRSTLG